MSVLDSSSVGFNLDLDEIFKDSAKSRAAIQNNEDKIEQFNKWSENMVRFVKTILEETSSKVKRIYILDLKCFRNGANVA